MQYFKNKVVTVLTHRSARDFPPNEVGSYQFAQHFTGHVEAADDYGLWLLDPAKGVRSYFLYSGLVGVCEEQVVAEDHPLVKQAAERAAKRPQQQDLGVSLQNLTAGGLGDAVKAMGGGR